MAKPAVTNFGVFGNLVSTAGCLAASAVSIRLAWMDRAKWQPPEEVLPKVGSKFAGLVSMIIIACIFVFGRTSGLLALAILSGSLLMLSILALFVTIFVNISFSFYYPTQIEDNRILGGFNMTAEAKAIYEKHGHSEQEMLNDVHGDRDKIWPRQSRALVSIISIVSFIFLISLGCVDGFKSRDSHSP